MLPVEQTYANYVDEEGVKRINKLEKELGMLVIAYTTPSVPSDLTPEQLKKVEELEKELCVRLVAYQTH